MDYSSVIYNLCMYIYNDYMAVFRHTQFVNVVKIQHLQLTRVETCFLSQDGTT